MPRDEHLIQALRETIDGALKGIRSLSRDLHQLAIQQTREAAEHSALLGVLEKRLDKLEKRFDRMVVGRDQVAAAKVDARGRVNVQLIATIGAVGIGLAGLVVALLK